MTQEDKELLLKDLCTRLPYGVIIETTWKEKGSDKNCDGTIGRLRGSQLEFFIESEYSSIKPYLRPMSSMTEEEKEELKFIFDVENITNDSICFLEGGTLEEYEAQIPFSFCSKFIDWLNAHHFDYRGLIEMGLAIAVTEKNNPYRNK